jgi:hypothetical protein
MGTVGTPLRVPPGLLGQRAVSDKVFKVKCLTLDLTPESIVYHSDILEWNFNLPGEACDRIANWDRALKRDPASKYVVLFRAGEEEHHAEFSENFRGNIWEVLRKTLPDQPFLSPMTQVVIAYCTPKPNVLSRFERQEVL